MKVSEASILVIENDKKTAKIIDSSIQNFGISKVTVMDNGFDAIEFARTRKPVNLVVVGMILPGTDGLSLIQGFRQIDGYEKTHFILVADEVNESEIKIAIDLGLDEYVIKPFKQTAFIKIVKAIMYGTNKKVTLQAFKSRKSEQQKAIKSENKQYSFPENILIVDDLTSNLDVVSGFLKGQYRCRVAKTGLKALQISASKVPPDLILLDIMMPEIDGFEVCKKLKENTKTANIPIIFLSAMMDDDEVTKGLSLGAVDFIHKPVSKPVLLARISLHLRLALSNKPNQQALKLEKTIGQMKLENKSLRSLHELLKTENAELKNNLNLLNYNNLNEKDEAESPPIPTPIATPTVQSNLDSSLSDEKAVSLDDLEYENYELLGLVNNPIILYQLKNNTFPIQLVSINVTGVIRQIIKDLRFISREQIVKISHTESKEAKGLSIQFDEILFYSLFSNLLHNAINAASEKTTIHINIDVDENKENLIIFINNNNWIEEEIREVFFEKYTSSIEEPNVGLGSYAAKIIVQQANGSINFELLGSSGTEEKSTEEKSTQEKITQMKVVLPIAN